MQIHIPNSAFLGNIDPFLKSMDLSEKGSLEITFNEKWVSVHPLVLSMVTTLGLSIQDNSKLIIHTPEAKSKHYFERIGFFKLLGHTSGIEIIEHEASGRFIPLTIVKNSSELNNFITDMIPLLHCDPEHVEPIRYIISELVRNVFEHSKSENGAVLCAQYYKDSNTIRIGVADNGIGLNKALSNAHCVDSDMNAIKLALTPGITGTTRNPGGTELNAGAGLFFIRSIAKVNKDFFVIYSGNTMYKLLRSKDNMDKGIYLYADPFKERHNVLSDLPYWSGTAVGIDICLNRNQNFDTILDMIREAYHKDVRENKKKKYKKARFA